MSTRRSVLLELVASNLAVDPSLTYAAGAPLKRVHLSRLMLKCLVNGASMIYFNDF